MFETRCWARIASFAGSNPQFVDTTLVFTDWTSAYRWDPETDAVSAWSHDDLGNAIGERMFVLRGWDEALIEDPAGTVAAWRGGPSPGLNLSPRRLCAFGFLSSDTAFAVSVRGHTIWSLDGPTVLAQTSTRSLSFCLPGRGAAASSAGRLALVDYGRSVVLVSDAADEVAERELVIGRPAELLDLAWTSRGGLYIVGATDTWETESGAVWFWEPGDAEPELVSLHPEALSSIAVSDSFVAVGMADLGHGGGDPDRPRPPRPPLASHVELLELGRPPPRSD